MDTVTYKNKNYPVRTFEVQHEHTGDKTTTYTIGVDSLWDAIMGENGDPVDEGGEIIDMEIYHYIPDEELSLDAEHICKNLLDIEMKFISEL